MPRTVSAWLGSLAVVLLLAGCGGGAAVDYYQGEELRNQARSLEFQLDYDQDSNAFVFDEQGFVLRLSVYPDRAYHLGMELDNQTDRPITIYWNGIEYLDLRGNPHSMIHDGVHYLDPVSRQRPTVIPPDGDYSDLLRPADRQEQDGALRLVKVGHPTGSADFGDDLILVIPMKVEGELRSYRFHLPVGDLLSAGPDEVDPFWY